MRLFSRHFVPLFTAHWTALKMQSVLSDVYLGSLSLEETAEIQATHWEVMKLTCFNDKFFVCFIGFDRNLSLLRCCFTFSFALYGDLEWDVYMMNLVWKESAPLFQSRRKYLTRCMLWPALQVSKRVGDREEGKKGGGLGREGGEDAPFLFPFRAFLPPLSPSSFYAYLAGYVRWMFEINELYLMLSFLVVFFGYLILFRLIAALQMADSKNCSTSVSMKKRPCTQVFLLVSGVSQTRALSISVVTFQEDCRFTAHVRNKPIKANKCLFILRSLRKEGYTQTELDDLFQNRHTWFDL